MYDPIGGYTTARLSPDWTQTSRLSELLPGNVYQRRLTSSYVLLRPCGDENLRFSTNAMLGYFILFFGVLGALPSYTSASAQARPAAVVR